MKFNKVAELCKRSRAVYILTERDEDGVIFQYLCVGDGIYPLNGFPPIDACGLLRILDVPEDRAAEWMVKMELMPKKYDLRSVTCDDLILRKLDCAVDDHGTILIPYISLDNDVFWIALNTLAPFMDEKFDLYERGTDRMVYVKLGMFTIGAVASRAIRLDTMEALNQAITLPQYQPEKTE